MYSKRLRDETAPRHERIESLLDLSRDDFSLADYKRLLSRHLGWIEPWERRVEAFEHCSGLCVYEGRTKAPWLLEDLRAVGLSEEAIEHLPRNQSSVQLESLPQVLGSMYVVEGSTLGGGFLAKQFETRFGLSAERGLRYFSNYGTQRGARWASFREVLETSLTDETLDAAVASANETFMSLEVWLTEGQV